MAGLLFFSVNVFASPKQSSRRKNFGVVVRPRGDERMNYDFKVQLAFACLKLARVRESNHKSRSESRTPNVFAAHKRIYFAMGI